MHSTGTVSIRPVAGLLASFKASSSSTNSSIDLNKRVSTVGVEALQEIIPFSIPFLLPEVSVISSDKLSKEHLVQTIERDSKNPVHYYKLGIILSLEETVLITERTSNLEEPASKEIELCGLDELEDIFNESSKEACSLLDSKPVLIEEVSTSLMTNKQLFIKAIELGSTDGMAHYQLARILSPSARVNIRGKFVGIQELLKEAVELDCKIGEVYFLFALNLAPKERISSQDGKIVDLRLGLFQKAIQCNPKIIQAMLSSQVSRKLNLAEVYCRLGRLLPKELKRTMFDNETTNEQRFYLNAIQWDDSLALAYSSLALTNISSSGIWLKDSKDEKFLMKKKHLFSKADHLLFTTPIPVTDNQVLRKTIEWGYASGIVYFQLALNLGPEETVSLVEQPVGQLRLLEKAIQLDPNVIPKIVLGAFPAAVYYQLGKRLSEGVRGAKFDLMTRTGTTNEQKLYVRAIESDATFKDAYESLLDVMKPEQILMINEMKCDRASIQTKFEHLHASRVI